ncbi:50S ribosomal protein L13 [soil metagenome]
MKTYSAKPTEVTRIWHVIDAAEAPLGRISTVAAKLLTGKNKPMYTPHIDCGDFVVIINAANLVVTGSKMDKKVYYRHTQFPGGLKETALKDKLSKNPTEVVYKAVRGMLPVNKLRQHRLERLKIYAGTEHPHDPQKPQTLSVKGAMK